MIKYSPLLASIVWGASSLGLATSAAAQTEPTWLIVEVAPMSGPASTVGTRLNRSAKMWADEAQQSRRHQGRRFAWSHATTRAARRRPSLHTRRRPRRSSPCFRSQPDREPAGDAAILANGPVMIIASPNIVPSADSLAFQTSPSDEHLAEAIAHFLKQNNINKIGMIAATDASGEAGVLSARKVFSEQKINLQLARIDLKATDATTQIAAVAGADIKVVYSSYSGAGAATVVKSFFNLDLKQPLIVSYANLSQAFIDVVKSTLPPRLLGTSVRALVPASISDPVLRERVVKFVEAYRKTYNEPADMNNIIGKFNADVAQAILENVANPSDGKAVKAFLEGAVIESLHRIKFSPRSHVGLGADDVIIAEFKGNEWIAAGPVR